jgi:hypothetical protein
MPSPQYAQSLAQLLRSSPALLSQRESPHAGNEQSLGQVKIFSPISHIMFPQQFVVIASEQSL